MKVSFNIEHSRELLFHFRTPLYCCAHLELSFTIRFGDDQCDWTIILSYKYLRYYKVHRIPKLCLDSDRDDGKASWRHFKVENLVQPRCTSGNTFRAPYIVCGSRPCGVFRGRARFKIIHVRRIYTVSINHHHYSL